MLPPHSCRARPHHRHHRNQQNVARQSLRVMSVFCGDSCVQQATLIPLYPSHPHVHNRIHVCVIASHNTLHYPGLGASILAKSFLTPAHRPPVASAAPARIRHRPSIIPYAVCRNPKQCVPPHPSSHATASLMSCTPTSSSSQESTKCSPAITSSHQTRPCTVFGAQHTSAGVFGRLPQASKVAKRGPAPFSGLSIRRRAFLAACRRLQKSPNAALHRFRGSAYVGGRFWPLAAGFKSRQTRPCTVFGAQHTSAGVFGRLPQASKVAKRGPAPFSGLSIRRRAFLAACRGLQKSPNAALHRFRGSAYVGGRFWPLAAGFKSRQTRPCTVFGAQHTSAGVFGRLPQASKVAKRGPAPFSGLSIRRRAFLAACRRLQKSPNAALHRFRGSAYVGGRFWPLAAGFKSRQTRPCTVFGAQHTSAGVFGRLPQASKVAKRGPAPFSGLSIRRRAFLAACRRLQKSPNAFCAALSCRRPVGNDFSAALPFPLLLFIVSLLSLLAPPFRRRPVLTPPPLHFREKALHGRAQRPWSALPLSMRAGPNLGVARYSHNGAKDVWWVA